jgi:hypothetical protein
VFTARYALSPYINQIRFVFKGLIYMQVPSDALSSIRNLRTLHTAVTAGATKYMTKIIWAMTRIIHPEIQSNPVITTSV